MIYAIGTKVIVGDFDIDHAGVVVGYDNQNRMIVEIDFYGQKRDRVIDQVNNWIAGVVE